MKIKNEPGTLETLLDTLIPSTISNLQLPDPELLNYYRDIGERTIWIDSEITESVLNIAKKIIDWNREDKDIPVDQRKPIKVMVYSYGGDLHACLSLVDTMMLSKTPIHTYNMGIAMSAGLLILLAGHKRYCVKRSQALIHSGSGGASGSFEQVQANIKNYEKIIDIMRDYILERTKIDKPTFNKYKSKEWYLHADEQVKYDIVQKIIDNVDELL